MEDDAKNPDLAALQAGALLQGASLAGKTILIAEDSMTVRGYLRRALRAQYPGCDIAEVEDGEAALLRLRKRDVHFMVTDLKMPKLDGIDMLRIACQESLLDGVGVLVLSSSISARMEADYGRQGNIAFLRKPAVQSDICQSLNRMAQRVGLAAASLAAVAAGLLA